MALEKLNQMPMERILVIESVFCYVLNRVHGAMVQKWAFHVCLVLIIRLGRHRDVLEQLSRGLDTAYC